MFAAYVAVGAACTVLAEAAFRWALAATRDITAGPWQRVEREYADVWFKRGGVWVMRVLFCFGWPLAVPWLLFSVFRKPRT